jgi:uncharacterized coiled-coil DUF342 family protein
MNMEQEFNLSKNDSQSIVEKHQTIAETSGTSTDDVMEGLTPPREFREKLSIHAEALRDGIESLESYMYSLTSPTEQSLLVERIQDMQKHLDSINSILKTHKN